MPKLVVSLADHRRSLSDQRGSDYLSAVDVAPRPQLSPLYDVFRTDPRWASTSKVKKTWRCLFLGIWQMVTVAMARHMSNVRDHRFINFLMQHECNLTYFLNWLKWVTPGWLLWIAQHEFPYFLTNKSWTFFSIVPMSPCAVLAWLQVVIAHNPELTTAFLRFSFSHS